MTVVRLKTRKSEAEQTTLYCLRQAVIGSIGHGVSEGVATRIATILDREMQSRSGWVFVMVQAELNSAVVSYLTEHSRRPLKAVRLWAQLFTMLPSDSNEILATRQELADMIGIEPRTVTEIMSELEVVGAVYRQRRGRTVRYFVNPILGTHLSGAARDKAQAAAPELRLVEPA
jgi:DNA-binding transcriptional ArsR family regulator